MIIQCVYTRKIKMFINVVYGYRPRHKIMLTYWPHRYATCFSRKTISNKCTSYIVLHFNVTWGYHCTHNMGNVRNLCENFMLQALPPTDDFFFIFMIFSVLGSKYRLQQVTPKYSTLLDDLCVVIHYSAALTINCLQQRFYRSRLTTYTFKCAGFLLRNNCSGLQTRTYSCAAVDFRGQINREFFHRL